MAILRRLLIASIFALLASASIHAQATIIDGSQTNLVIVGSGNSATGFVAWRSKFIPSHMIFAFELPAGFTAVNPVVRCSLDDQALTNVNPNDASRWQQVAISALQSPIGGTAFDAAGPSVGTVGSATVIIVETGVYPCVDWAISPGSPTFNGSGNSKVTAVQLPASGDAAFLGSTGTILTSGGPRVVGGGSVSPATGPTVSPKTNTTINDFANADYEGFLNGVGSTPSLLADTPFLVCNPTHQACKLRLAQNSAILTGLAATTTQIIAGVGGAQIRIQAMVLSNTGATASNVSVVVGTGVNCATGPTTLLAPVPLTQNQTVQLHFGDDAPLTHAAVTGESVCLTGSAAGSVNATLIFEAD